MFTILILVVAIAHGEVLPGRCESACKLADSAPWTPSSSDSSAFHPTVDQLKARFGVIASRPALVNGAVKQLQRDSLGQAYTGSTNLIDGDIVFGMGEVFPVKEWSPRDILECYILRPIDKNNYKEKSVIITPGSPTDTSDSIHLHVTYNGASMSLPLVPELPSEFTFDSNVDKLSVTNTDHYDILVEATVLVPFEALPGDAVNRENYCDTDAILGK